MGQGESVDSQRHVIELSNGAMRIMRKERMDLDYYATPAWCTRQILDALELRRPILGGAILDPSCGDGAILRVAAERGYAGLGVELDPERARKARDGGADVTCADALGSTWYAAEALIGNPPFTLAGEFAGKAAAWSAKFQRPAALLLRLSFAESAKRQAFHSQNPSDIFVLPVRPRFRTDTSGTDSHAYAWFVWGPYRGGRWRVLPMPAKEER